MNNPATDPTINHDRIEPMAFIFRHWSQLGPDHLQSINDTRSMVATVRRSPSGWAFSVTAHGSTIASGERLGTEDEAIASAEIAGIDHGTTDRLTWH